MGQPVEVGQLDHLAVLTRQLQERRANPTLVETQEHRRQRIVVGGWSDEDVQRLGRTHAARAQDVDGFVAHQRQEPRFEAAAFGVELVAGAPRGQAGLVDSILGAVSSSRISQHVQAILESSQRSACRAVAASAPRPAR